MVFYEYCDASLSKGFSSYDKKYLMEFYDSYKDCKEILDKEFDIYTPIRMQFNCYKFHDAFLDLYRNGLHVPLLNGYHPLPESGFDISLNELGNEDVTPDSAIINCIKQVISWSKEYGFKLIIPVSPRATYHKDENHYLEEICADNGVTYINNVYLPGIIDGKDFRDADHLSDVGATIYSLYFVSQINNKIK